MVKTMSYWRKVGPSSNMTDVFINGNLDVDTHTGRLSHGLELRCHKPGNQKLAEKSGIDPSLALQWELAP